ncbi:S8 family serine peptidase [Microbacterium sp. ASV81]|uniref:S8 family serine peptidase n=1 Tax=Microbacterium capsulatum TaxID=3041921 RepID=A0ABU0XKW6_9MICO|nr:S8 family serine peptidase [Microbacterium sp. ASV81]MDQ4215269.1 S8 family serine peptidase [Microbacterium sp. ASV81]
MRRTTGILGVAALVAAGLLAAPAASAAGEACRPGQVVLTPSTPPALVSLGAAEANKRATGRGVTVAVVDSGIDAGNLHLAGAVAGGVNLVGDGERPDGLSDPLGHGTVIAGEIAARPVAGSGVVGLAPDASLLSVRVFRSDTDDDAKKGFGPTPARIADGIRWAADHGARVINVSLSTQQDAPELRAAVAYAAAQHSLVVASAGNRAAAPDAPNGVRYPAGYPGALGVSAAADDGRSTDDSIHGPQVALTAPGANVLSTATGAGDCQFDAVPSASFATAYVSGAAALVAQAHPSEPVTGWAYRLTATALRADADRRDDRDGWGFVQPAAANTLLPDASTRGPAGPFSDAGRSAMRPQGAQAGSDPSASPFVRTQETAILAAVVAAALLGLLTTLLLLRRRRSERAEASAATPPRPGGLFGQEKPDLF